MSELAELMEAMMEFHNKASKTLEKMIADVQTSRSYADKVRNFMICPLMETNYICAETRAIEEAWRGRACEWFTSNLLVLQLYVSNSYSGNDEQEAVDTRLSKAVSCHS